MSTWTWLKNAVADYFYSFLKRIYFYERQGYGDGGMIYPSSGSNDHSWTGPKAGARDSFWVLHAGVGVQTCGSSAAAFPGTPSGN